MPDDKPDRKIARQLSIDLYEDGGWELHYQPQISGLIKFEVLAILELITAYLRSPPPIVSSQGIDEGTGDVGKDRGG